MQTPLKLKLLSDSKEKPDLDLPVFRKSLPENIQVKDESDGIYLYVAGQEMSDAQILYLVNRELDRHFFLTCVRITATIVKKRVVMQHATRYGIHGELPEGILPQQWTYELAIQLRLWAVAIDTDDLALKVILLYQVIELSKLQSAPYTESKAAPDPLTECRLIRNLVTHAGDVKDAQLRRYCAHIGLPEVMLDPTDLRYIAIIQKKVPLLEEQAKKIISGSISGFNET